jgi:hypothetical protein
MRHGGGTLVVDQVNWHGRTGTSEGAARYLSTLLTNLGVAFRDPETGLLLDGAAMRPSDGTSSFSARGTAARLIANGSVIARVRFASAGTYVFEVAASGTAVRGEFPEVQLLLDGRPVEKRQLRGGGRETISYSCAVGAGVHDVELAFTNDAWEPPEDRNLEISSLRIARLP